MTLVPPQHVGQLETTLPVGSSFDVPINIPSFHVGSPGLQAGDLILVWCHDGRDGFGFGRTVRTWSAEAGWTKLGQVNSDVTSDAIFYKFAVGGETTANFTTDAATTSYSAFWAVAYRGVNPADPVSTSKAMDWGTPNSTAGDITFPSLSGLAGQLRVGVIGASVSVQSFYGYIRWNTPSGWTEEIRGITTDPDGIRGAVVLWADTPISADGPTGTAVATENDNAYGGSYFEFLLNGDNPAQVFNENIEVLGADLTSARVFNQSIGVLGYDTHDARIFNQSVEVLGLPLNVPDGIPSAEAFGNPIVELGPIPVSTGSTFLPIVTTPFDRANTLSGIEINQNQKPASDSDHLVPAPTAFIYQTFRLPEGFRRAGIDAPDITGLQVCLDITDINLAVDYVLEYKINADSWVTILDGTETGSQATGDKVWFDIYFDQAFEVSEPFLDRHFRFGIKTSASWWYSLPNPLPGEGLFNSNGGSIGNGASGMFRLLTASADSGTDFLGNLYRSVVHRSSVAAIQTDSAAPNSQWLSKPNPSKFAVESLHFDLSDDDGHPTVVDRILLDPITPNVLFHVYYSNQGTPGVDNDSWNDRLWTPVLHTFKAERRQEHALPEPIVAKYVKIEFSHLQAKSYAAGTFQAAMRYQKHPKWVADYFLTLAGVDITSADAFVPRQVNVSYDAIKFAFDYYLDDLRQDPKDPVTAQSVQQFLTDTTGEHISTDVAQRISTNLSIYQDRIAAVARSQDSILATASTSDIIGHPVEARRPAAADTSQVSTLQRDDLLQELNYPPMFFYVACRHIYREVEATFKDDRGYFVGIRELAFTRDHYAVAYDTPIYIEATGDLTNTWRSDLINVDGIWRV